MKKIQAMVKLQIAAGKATPAPPVGTALGPQGVNIMDFCKNFNAKTAKDEGLIIPVVVTVYADRSYSFITEMPPAPILLKRAANIAKGSAARAEQERKSARSPKKQVEKEIAKIKLPDLNCDSLDSAIRTVAGTARSMGDWTLLDRAAAAMPRLEDLKIRAEHRFALGVGLKPVSLKFALGVGPRRHAKKSGRAALRARPNHRSSFLM